MVLPPTARKNLEGVVAGWGEEDEGLVEGGDELGDDAAEYSFVSLEGEEGGDRIGGPGTDLGGVREAEVGGFGVEEEGAAEGAAEFGAVHLKWGDVLDGEFEVGAVGGVAVAGGDGAGAVKAAKDSVPAAAVFWAGVFLGLEGAVLEAELFEGREVAASEGMPV
jgi:hypothetical protein